MTDAFVPILPDQFGVGESLVWDERSAQLLWCDIPAGVIHALDPANGERQSWAFGESVGSFGLCASGRLVVALVNTIVLFDRVTAERTPLCTITHARPGMRLNDGRIGPDGAFWVASLDGIRDDEAGGALYRVTADGIATVKRQNLKLGNGIAFADAGRAVFLADSRQGWIDRANLDPASGTVGPWQTLHRTAPGEGPDGACVDAADGYWIALSGADALLRFDPAGRQTHRIDLPRCRPTIPCLGGPSLDRFYVASMSAGSDDPQAGKLLAGPSPFAGRLDYRFADLPHA